MDNQPTIEENFASIEETIQKLESKDISLEESFALYQKGMATLKQCNEQINTVEKKVQVISQDGTLADFKEE